MENNMINYPIPNAEYLHYKGGRYRVLFLSKHTETGEIFVNYQSLLFGSYHSRPLDLWNEKLENGDERFKLIK
jgi:hypothetical protein